MAPSSFLTSLALCLALQPLSARSFSTVKGHTCTYDLHRQTPRVNSPSQSSLAVIGDSSTLSPSPRPTQLLYQSNNYDQDGDDGPNSQQSFLASRLEYVDPLEIRLDATLAAIYVLCRFLIFDITTGAKDRPGWELHDVIMLLQTFSSAIALAVLWTGAGVLTRNFEDGSSELNVRKVVWTAALSAPIWVLLEIHIGWPPAGILYASGEDLVTLVTTSSIGLCSIMLLGKYFTSGWR